MENVPVIGQLHKYLSENAPNELLTVALLGVAIVAIVVGFFGDPLLKAAVLAWMVFP